MKTFIHWLLAALLLTAAPARADFDDEARAKSLYQRGMAHFQLDEYEVAIQLWQQAYRLKPVPELLYDIAQAYRFSSERSLAYYKKFLNQHPNAPNRAEVERQIAALTRFLSEQQAPPPVPAKPPPAPAEIKLPAFMLKPARPIDPPRAAPQLVALLAHPPDGSIARRGWFWAGLGITAAVIAVGVGVGVTYGTRPGNPNPSFGVVRGN